jgi:3-deoxy-D-manno-octulosonic-acid transferase
LDAIKDLDILTVIVPRHPQRFDEVAALFKQRGIDFQLKTSLNSNALEANIHAGARPTVILGDSMGELFTYYAASDFAFIGGSLLPLGGQNLIEAASMGKPILIGPHTFNFAEASKNAIETGAALLVNNVAELRERIQDLQKNTALREKMSKAANRYSEASTGATARLLRLIQSIL